MLEGSLHAPQAPSEAGSATPSVSNVVPSSGRGRRGSASRAVQAVQEAFPLSVAPSPLIRARSPNSLQPPKIKRLTKGENPMSEAEIRILQLRKELEEVQPKPLPVNYLKRLPEAVLRLVISYVGTNLADQRVAASSCRSFYNATFPMIREITLYPEQVSIAGLSKVGSLANLASALRVSTRGQHITKFTIMKSSSVYSLSNDVYGPEVGAYALTNLIMNMPYLTHLDVRGIKIRDFAPWKDYFLADIAQNCPRLQSLKVGAQFLRNWEPHWWQNLSTLNEFVVGSRREDCDWHDATPLQLHEDFFAMLKSPTHNWKIVKIWCALTQQSMTQLLMPTMCFPNLHHLTVNAHGNTGIKPMDDLMKDETAAVPEKKKPDPKAAKKGAQDESQNQSKFAFPAMQSFAIADVKERPELANELMVRYSTAAPALKHFNVVNTHRNAPGRVVAAPVKPTRAKPAAAAQ